MTINQMIVHAYGQFTETFSRTSTIHLGIFLVRSLWADSASPQMNTMASREQFKPIRIGESLVVIIFSSSMI